MNISIFDVLGPVMVGPSSSHTAGAARIGNIARSLSQRPFHKVSFGLNGSFLQTGKGHGTKRALLAGVLGVKRDDERIVTAYELAAAAGLEYKFHPVQLKDAHANSVLITITYDDGTFKSMTASSVGGGRVSVDYIDGFEVGAGIELPTIILRYRDEPGVISEVTRLLADAGVNIAAMKVSRNARGMKACCVIETDSGVCERLFAPMEATGRIDEATVICP